MDSINTEIHIEELDSVYGLYTSNCTVCSKKTLLHVIVAIERCERLGVLDNDICEFFSEMSIPELMNFSSKSLSTIYLNMRKALQSKIQKNNVPSTTTIDVVSCFDIEPDLPKNFKEIAGKISKQATKNDKMSWWRLQRELKILLSKLGELNVPYFEYHQKVKECVLKLESENVKLIIERDNILEHIDDIREKMKAECIHPSDQIAYVNGEYVCKFCDTKISLIEGST